MKEVLEKVRAELDAKRAAAATAWTEFDAKRASFTDSVKKGEVSATDAEAFKALDDAGKVYDGLKDEIGVLETRWARLAEMEGEKNATGQPGIKRGTDGAAAPAGSSWGERFTESAEYTQIKEKIAGGMGIGQIGVKDLVSLREAKTLLQATGGSGQAQYLVVPDRQAGILSLPQPALSILDVITIGDTTSDTVEWVVEKTFTNAAAEIAEGAASNESTLEFDIISDVVRDIRHWIPVTTRILADAGQLRSFVDSRMVFGVRKRLAQQIISGDGIGENLKGILNTAGVLSQAQGADSLSDAIHKGMTKIRIAQEGLANVSVLMANPTDLEKVFLEKDQNGNYIYGPPSQPFPRRIWGMSPIDSTLIPEGQFIVGDFALAVMLLLREGIALAASDSHSDFFVKAKVALRAGLRAALGVPTPSALCTIDE